MSKKILNIGTFGLAGALLKPFGKDKSPAVAGPETPVMPLADDAAIAMAKKRSISMQLKRGGRSSTILTDTTNDLLGG